MTVLDGSEACKCRASGETLVISQADRTFGRSNHLHQVAGRVIIELSDVLSFASQGRRSLT
jgi:hypothetical protein